jgi:hypothetical protein
MNTADNGDASRSAELTAYNERQRAAAQQRPPGGYLRGEKPAAPIVTGQTSGTAAEQAAYRRGQQDAVRTLTTPRMSAYRVVCGLVWAFWTVVLVISAFASFSSGSAIGLIALILAGLAGWYDYRIWSLKARRLTIFLIF